MRVQVAHDLEPADHRHHQIENDRPVPMCAKRGQGFLTVAGLFDGEVLTMKNPLVTSVRIASSSTTRTRDSAITAKFTCRDTIVHADGTLLTPTTRIVASRRRS